MTKEKLPGESAVIITSKHLDFADGTGSSIKISLWDCDSWRVSNSGKSSSLVSGKDKLQKKINVRQDNNGWISLEYILCNKSVEEQTVSPQKLLSLDTVKNFLTPGGNGAVKMFVNGRWTSDNTGIRDLSGKSRDLFAFRDWSGSNIAFENLNRSWSVTALWRGNSNHGMVLGFSQPVSDGAYFWPEKETVHAGYGDIRIVLKPNRETRLATLLINPSIKPDLGLEEYAGFFQSKRPIKQFKQYAGWNSFDFYRNSETLSDIIHEGKSINDFPAVKKICKYLVIDSSYEFAWGEWDVVPHRYPGGLKRMVSEIRKLGFNPGIWFAPFMVQSRCCHISHWKPEWLLRGPDGKAVCKVHENAYYVMDPTNPGVIEYILKFVREMKKAGFDYFKADFLVHVLEGVSFYKKDYTPSMALRYGMQKIREAIGEDSFLIGCMAPMDILNGVVDSVRTGQDMHNFWSNAQICGRSIALRWWLNGKWHINDPDMFMIRGPQTASAPFNPFPSDEFRPFVPFSQETGQQFSYNEAVTWMTLTLLSGGLFTLCDPVAKLNNKGKTILKKSATAITEISARPLDFCEKFIPALWLQETENPRLGLINWYDKTSRISFNVQSLNGVFKEGDILKDLWSGKPFTVKKHNSITLPAHGSLYLSK